MALRPSEAAISQNGKPDTGVKDRGSNPGSNPRIGLQINMEDTKELKKTKKSRIASVTRHRPPTSVKGAVTRDPACQNQRCYSLTKHHWTRCANPNCPKARSRRPKLETSARLDETRTIMEADMHGQTSGWLESQKPSSLSPDRASAREPRALLNGGAQWERASLRGAARRSGAVSGQSR